MATIHLITHPLSVSRANPIKQGQFCFYNRGKRSNWRRLKELKTECKAINLLPIYIEDKASGSILLQQAKRRSVNVKAIDSKFSAMSKSERAIAASGAVYQGRVKISQYAYDKQINLKGVRKNHWLSQVTQFRIGNDHGTQADDLLDTFTYAVLQLNR